MKKAKMKKNSQFLNKKIFVRNSDKFIKILIDI